MSFQTFFLLRRLSLLGIILGFAWVLAGCGAWLTGSAAVKLVSEILLRLSALAIVPFVAVDILLRIRKPGLKCPSCGRVSRWWYRGDVMQLECEQCGLVSGNVITDARLSRRA